MPYENVSYVGDVRLPSPAMQAMFAAGVLGTFAAQTPIFRDHLSNDCGSDAIAIVVQGPRPVETSSISVNSHWRENALANDGPDLYVETFED